MKQNAGDSSENYQAGRDIIVGLSYEDARRISLDVFRANIHEYSEKAAKKAEDRAIEISEKFLERLYQETPEVIEKLEEPAVQSSMFNTQKEYAKTGDKDLEGRLLDVLIERIRSEERSLKQIVLDEALLVLPKLTPDQINILTLIFAVGHIQPPEVVSINTLQKYVNVISACAKKIEFSDGFYAHLRYTGCCSLIAEGATWKPIEEIFLTRYKGLFSKGFPKERLHPILGDAPDIESIPYIIKNLHNASLLQVNALNDRVLRSTIEDYKHEPLAHSLHGLFNEHTMSTGEVSTYLKGMTPEMLPLIDEWKKDKSSLKSVSLTSVGFAIALLHYNKLSGSAYPLDMFL